MRRTKTRLRRLFQIATTFTLIAAGTTAAANSQPSPPNVALEVILRDGYPTISYPFAQPTTSMAIPMQAFGVDCHSSTCDINCNLTEWQEWSGQQINEAFDTWFDEHIMNGTFPPLPKEVGLNFEKCYTWLDPANHSSISHAFRALRSVFAGLEANIRIGLFGMPYAVRNNCVDNPAPCEFPYLPYHDGTDSFIADLDLDFAIPSLYIKDNQAGEPPWMTLVTARTDLALDIAGAFEAAHGILIRPYLWHRLSQAGNNSTPLWWLDPSLDNSLRPQLKILEDRGIEEAYFWSADDEYDLVVTFWELFTGMHDPVTGSGSE